MAGREKLLVLDMFPYPSGAGLHVGHPLGYIATDVYARFHRMTGKNVLHCLGYDAFGLPAERYAVQTGQHPRETTEENMVNMKRQAAAPRPGPRRPADHRDDRPRLLPLDPVDLPADLQLLVRRRRGPRGRRARGAADQRAGRAVRERRPPDAERPGREALSPSEQSAILDSHRLACTSRHRSTGAPAWEPCSPTRRSPTRAAPSAATTRSSSAACASG